MEMSRQTGIWSDRARWWTLKRFDTPAARALLMDEGVRNVKAILVAKDGVERGTALVLIGKLRTSSLSPNPRIYREGERTGQLVAQTEQSRRCPLQLLI
jgi:hypothetical protein